MNAKQLQRKINSLKKKVGTLSEMLSGDTPVIQVIKEDHQWGYSGERSRKVLSDIKVGCTKEIKRLENIMKDTRIGEKEE